MKKGPWYFFLVAVVFALGACGTTDPPEEPDNEMPPAQEEPADQDNTNDDGEDVGDTDDGGDDTDADNQEPVAKEVEPEIVESIQIEGMAEDMTFELYDSDIAPFVTYIPEDFIAEEASGGEGDSFWFYTNYVGEKNEDVYLQVYIFSEDISEEPSADDGDSTFANLVTNMEELADDERMYDWAIREYQSAEGSNHAMLGEHNGRYFAMVLHSTVEYSEGFYPRANKIIEHFYWTDTQEYLVE